MNPEIFRLSDGPAIRAWISAEEVAIERLLDLASSHERIDPARAMQIRVEAIVRTDKVLLVREWLDLQ